MRSQKWLLTGCLAIISPDWFDRYVHRFELQRFPKGKQAQEDLAQAGGRR